jgi:hypothetical protein
MATSLERQTLAQSTSLSDLRLREAIENLAMVAHDPATLPCWSSVYAGTSDLNDTATATSATEPFVRSAAKPAGYVTTFGTESLDLPYSRTVKLTWTLDPSVAPEKLRAMRCACRWVLFGPEGSVSDFDVFLTKAPASLLYPYPGSTPTAPNRNGAGRAGFYFNVADQLLGLRTGWVQTGCKKNVPACAAYKAACNGTYVWVAPDGVQDLTTFALVMQEIARVQVASTVFPPAITQKLQVVSQDNGITRTITAYVDGNGFLVSADGARAIQMPVRRDNVSSDAILRAQIANAKSSQ